MFPHSSSTMSPSFEDSTGDNTSNTSENITLMCHCDASTMPCSTTSVRTDINDTYNCSMPYCFIVEALHGVRLNHYHANNGLFDKNAFCQNIRSSKQTLSFCGPNAHHQNGKAEN
mmetsp:Transcript_18777/g.28567  ORF Transcript_18777/g.28567 Transcript_18777/m.28567 type:complete len:115 (-) Transcript_18777:827-1171(-)